MLTKRVIPCLDVNQGRVVKGVQFVDIQDAGDPAEVARCYNAEGADEITFLDITASSDRREIMLDLVTRVAAEVFIPMTVGGGVRTISDIRDLHRAGADKIAINTAAISNPRFVEEAATKVGAQCIVVAIDAKRCGAAPRCYPSHCLWRCRRAATLGRRHSEGQSRCRIGGEYLPLPRVFHRRSQTLHE